MNEQKKQDSKIENEKVNELSPDEKNKAQPNIALEKAKGGDSAEMGAGYRDTGRVSERANEAPDRTDSNTGGMISGGAKGASQS